MATNIDIQQQLNDLLEQQSKIMEAQAKMMKSQISLAQDLVDSLSKINYKGVAEDVTATQDAIDKAQASTSKLGSTNQSVYEQVKDSVTEATKNLLGFNEQTLDSIEKLGKLGFVAGSAMTGFIAGLKFTGNAMRTVASLGQGMLGFMGDLAASIIAIPFKMLSGLISMADTGGSNELAQALEDIRKEFGALHTTAGKAIIDISRSMKGELANSGLSVYRVMGNLAERLKAVAEWAKQLGPLFEVLAPQLIKNSEAFAAYNKGLGLSEAGLKALGARAFATGQDITEIQRQVANFSIQLGKSFGLSSKMISRDMGEMMADFKHFGSLAPQQLAQVSVYARKLGVDIKALVGVIDKFDNFEDAASGAAHLSQAFGLNVDALELMKAQNPAERVEMLRKAFFNAGRSVESMTRQERALLAQQSGVGDDALDLVFSLKNQAVSYADIQKKGGAAHKQQLTQAQAMKGLADSIERLVKSGSAGAGGFFDRFIQGFTVGIRRSTEFRQLMYGLQKSLMVVFQAGVRVGRMFVDMFPGVNDVLKGLREFFNPSKIRNLMKNVVEAFRDFFKALTKDPQTALPELLKKLQKNFFDFFKSNSAAGRGVLDGFKSFFKALAQIGASMLKLAFEGITTGVRYIIDLLQGNVALPGMGGAGGEATGFIGEILGPIIEALKSAWPPLWLALKNLFHEVLYNHVMPFLLKHAPLILGVLFGPSVIGMVGRTFTSTLITMFLGSLGKALTNSTLVSRGTSLVSNAFRRLSGNVQAVAASPAAGPTQPDIGTGAVTAAGNANDAVARTNPSTTVLQKLGLLALIVLGMAALLAEVFVFALAMKKYGLGITEVGGAALAMVATAGAMVLIAGAVKLLSAIDLNAGMLKSIALGLLIVGVVGAAMALGAYGLILAFKDFSLSDIGKTALIMAGTGAFFLAAAGVAAIAGIVGAMIGTGIGALAIGAGLIAIVAVIDIMAEQGMKIMHTLKAFDPGPGFVEKAKAFAAIMSAVGSFAGNIGTIIEQTRPSFIQFVFGNPAEEQRKTLASVQTIIRSISGGVIGIIDSLKPVINQLAGGEAQLKAAEALGTILTGISGLATALRAPAESLAEPGLWAQFTTGASTSRNLEGMSNYIHQMDVSIRNLMTRVQNIITGIGPGITEDQKRAIETIPGILSAMTGIATALRLSPEMIRELNKGASFTGQLSAMTTFVNDVLRGIMDSHIVSNVATLIMRFLHAIESANFSTNTVTILKGVLPAMTAIFGSIGQIATTIGTLVTATTGAHANVTAISEASRFIESMMSSISNHLPNILSSATTAFSSMTPRDARNLAAGATAFTSIMTAVTNLISGPVLVPSDIDAKFAALNMSLFSIQAGIDSVATRLSTSTLTGSIANLVTNIRDAHIERVSGAVKAMVDSINATGAALKGLHALDIETRLQSVAGNLGLGAAGQYRIDNRNFTIVVNFSVKIDQPGLEALELALTTHPRTRLNTSL